MTCPHCSQTIESTDQPCPHCGQPVEPRKRAYPRGFEMVCLMTGINLTNDIRKELYRAACDMGKNGREQMALTHPGFEGTLTTDFSYTAFNNLGGVTFTADLEADSTKGRVIFLVTNFEYREHGVWLPVTPIPESHPASKAKYN